LDLLRIAADIRIDDSSPATEEVCIERANQLTLFTDGAEGANCGAGIAWRENSSWKTRSMALGKYLTIVEVELFAIYIALKEAGPTTIRTGYQRVEIVSDSQQALTSIEKARHWSMPVIKNIYRQIRQLEAQGGTLRLSWIPAHTGVKGNEIADSTAKQVARQQPREMRSASVLYVLRCIKSKWQRPKKMNKHIGNGKKAVTARYLQLKSGNAVTGVRLLRTKRVQVA
jgi:ribonuclease HI